MKLTVQIDREMVEHLFYEYIDRDKDYGEVKKDVCAIDWDNETCRCGSLEEDCYERDCVYYRAFDLEHISLKVVCDVLEKHIDECVLISKE